MLLHLSVCLYYIFVSLQRPIKPPVRSNSAPSVVPSLYLLGTFEVNILKCGYMVYQFLHHRSLF